MLVRDVDLQSVAGPRLRRLAEDTRESVQLAVWDAGYVVYVDKVDSSQPLKAITSIGSRVPATVVSTGKAMLAWMPGDSLDRAMEHVKRYTPLTMTRRKDIERDLEETRERGYSINRGEFRAGVCGIAAPVRDRCGNVVAAIGVWGAEKAILGSRREDLSHMTVSAARDMSREMGFVELAGVRNARSPPQPASRLAVFRFRPTCGDLRAPLGGYRRGPRGDPTAGDAKSATAADRGERRRGRLEKHGRGLERGPIEHEVAVAFDHVLADLGIASSLRDLRADLVAQVEGERRVRVGDGLVLADEAAQLLGERLQALLDPVRRVWPLLSLAEGKRGHASADAPRSASHAPRLFG